MRNKKYRPYVLVLLLAIIAILGFSLIHLLQEKWARILFLVGGVFMVAVDILLVTLYFEIKDDRIVTRLGVESLDKRYRSSLKKRVFMFDDLTDIIVVGEKLIMMRLKDGSGVAVSIEGFFKKKEIISLIYEVRAQIKGCEHNNT